MKTAAVLATGPSLARVDMEKIRASYDIVVAVSDAYTLAPWAHALASNDAAWWDHHDPKFDGIRFCGSQPRKAQAQVFRAEQFTTELNSGAMGIRVAHFLGAEVIDLYGFDMHNRGGDHFFGSHPEALKNTTAKRFGDFREQFRRVNDYLKFHGVFVVNRTQGSALDIFPHGLELQ